MFTRSRTGASGVRSESNSGQPVDHSGPGLSRANNSGDSRSKTGGLPSSSQPKSGPGGGAQGGAPNGETVEDAI
jgi:hypothetical protein